MNNANTISTAKTSLKGSKFFGEWSGSEKSTSGQFLYRLATGKFVVVTKAEYSGKIIATSEPIEGRMIERAEVVNLGYGLVNIYRMKVVP